MSPVEQEKSPEEMTLAERIRWLRTRLGLSQSRLAKAADVTDAHVYQVEAGRRSRLNADTAEKYANALHVSVAFLLFGFEKEQRPGEIPQIPVVLRARYPRLSDEDINKVLDYVRTLERAQQLESLLEGSTSTPDAGMTESSRDDITQESV